MAIFQRLFLFLAVDKIYLTDSRIALPLTEAITRVYIDFLRTELISLSESFKLRLIID